MRAIIEMCILKLFLETSQNEPFRITIAISELSLNTDSPSFNGSKYRKKHAIISWNSNVHIVLNTCGGWTEGHFESQGGQALYKYF